MNEITADVYLYMMESLEFEQEFFESTFFESSILNESFMESAEKIIKFIKDQFNKFLNFIKSFIKNIKEGLYIKKKNIVRLTDDAIELRDSDPEKANKYEYIRNFNSKYYDILYKQIFTIKLFGPILTKLFLDYVKGNQTHYIKNEIDNINKNVYSYIFSNKSMADYEVDNRELLKVFMVKVIFTNENNKYKINYDDLVNYKKEIDEYSKNLDLIDNNVNSSKKEIDKLLSEIKKLKKSKDDNIELSRYNEVSKLMGKLQRCISDIYSVSYYIFEKKYLEDKRILEEFIKYMKS